MEGFGLRARAAPAKGPVRSGLEAVVLEAISPGSQQIGGDVLRAGAAAEEVQHGADGDAEAAPQPVEWDAIYDAVNTRTGGADLPNEEQQPRDAAPVQRRAPVRQII